MLACSQVGTGEIAAAVSETERETFEAGVGLTWCCQERELQSRVKMEAEQRGHIFAIIIRLNVGCGIAEEH